VTPVIGSLERHQVVVYVGAILAGAAVGGLLPSAGPGLEHAINPVLGALLYVTFLQLPAADLFRSMRAGRFLAAAMAVNFVVVPVVVAGLFVFVPDDGAVQLGVLLVLLCPCVDYVIVFSGLAGGASQRLLAATPLLLVAQMALLPLFLLLFMGSDLADVVEVRPFVEAFVVLIALPLALAWLTQAWATHRQAGRAMVRGTSSTMVVLMAATLVIVAASQVPKLDDSTADVLAVVPVYIAFLVVMAFTGLGVSRLFRLDAPSGRAIVFSGATRNSLVVLPLALALPDELAIAAVVVVTQTLVEIVGMVVYVRTVPRLWPSASEVVQ